MRMRTRESDEVVRHRWPIAPYRHSAICVIHVETVRISEEELRSVEKVPLPTCGLCSNASQQLRNKTINGHTRLVG